MLAGEPNPDVIHVYPNNDTREHVLEGEHCRCNVVIERYDQGTIIVHTAADGRETQERQFLHGAN